MLGTDPEISWTTVVTHKRGKLTMLQERKRKEIVIEKAICEMAPGLS